MPRRTKEDAAATRDALLDAAEAVFGARGVAAASLGDIAAAAGVTRGALYWHFRDKADLLQAMLARAIFPFEQQWRSAVDAADPLGQLERSFLDVLRAVAADRRMACIHAVVRERADPGGEFAPAQAQQRLIRAAFLQHVEALLQCARRTGRLRPRVVVRHAAIGLEALLDGLLRNWMLESSEFNLVRVGRAAVTSYLDGLRNASQEPHAPSPARGRGPG